jgi:excinuclease ABC subunit B
MSSREAKAQRRPTLSPIAARDSIEEAAKTEHGIEPRSIIKDVTNRLLQLANLDYQVAAFIPPWVGEIDVSNVVSLQKAITELEKQMKVAAKWMEFEEAAQLRDRIKELRAQQIYKT